MAIYSDCLAEAVKAEKISAATAARLTKLIADAEKEAESLGKSGVDAYTFATSKAAERMLDEVGRSKKDIAREILRTQMLMEDAPKNTAGVFRGLEAILGELRRGGGQQQGLVASQRSARNVMHAMLTDFLDDLRSKNFGLTRDRVAPRDTVTEVMGKSSGAEGAKANAGTWQKTLEWWRDAMENEGVHIRNLKDFFLPQEFNSAKVKNMGQDAFVAEMTQRWQNGGLRLRDFKSTADEALLTPGKDDARVSEILAEAWDGIAFKGNTRIEPGISNKETMGDRYNRRRVFEWTSPDAYFDFADTFGNGADNLGEAFTRHLHKMSQDLGTARVLGPDPDRMAKTLIQFGEQQKISQSQAKWLDTLYFHSSGQAQEPANVTWANSAQAVRSWLSGVQLSGATLSSLSDFAFLRSTAAFNGLGASRVMAAYVSELANTGGSRRLSRQLGLANETGLRGLRDHFDETLTANGGSLFRGEGLEAASAGMNRIAGHAAEFVMRGTGLEYHTNTARGALGKLFLGTLADHAGKGFEALPDRMGAFLQRYGIDAGQWDVLRAKAMHGEGLFMDPAYLAYSGTAAEREPAMRLLGAIDAEVKYGVPEGGVATRALMLGKTEAGTLAGEGRRSLQYLGFGLSATMMNGWRAIDNLMGRQGFMPRGQYLLALSIEATVLGGMSYQLKNIAQGKDPEAMDTADFWAKAASMGGAGGMLGDQVKRLWQTKSKADAARLLTPTGGLAVDTGALLLGNLNQAWHGENTNFGREATNWGRKYALPRLFYTNLGVDRLGWDTLQRMADPDAAGAFSRIEQRARHDEGTSYWWRPGQTEPIRPPNLEAVLGR